MYLATMQIEQFKEKGYLLIENLFDEKEVELIRTEMLQVIAEDCPRRILEKNGSVRSFFAPDHSNEIFEKIVKLKRLVIPAAQLIGTDVYAHQTKINSKSAMTGDWWEWHQDYTYWKKDDGMPAADVLTAMIYLNDVNEFNGPMLLIPGSHKIGTVDEGENISGDGENGNGWFEEYKTSTFYMTALTADLKYTLKQEEIARWAKQRGIESAKGPAGSVLFFHGNVFHASSNNLSPWDRYSFLVTYNSVNNQLGAVEKPRPAFIANRNFDKIIPVHDHL